MRTVPARWAVRIALLVMALLATPIAAQAQDLAAAQSEDLAGRIRDLLAGGGTGNVPFQELDLNALNTFYGARLYAPAWTGSQAVQANAGLALSTLEHADEDGLQPDRYHLSELDLRRRADTMPAAAEYELLLTDAMLRYARDLRQGRPGLRELDDDVGFPTEYFDAAGTLDQALRANRLNDFLASLPPPHPEYQYLKAALAQYRAAGADAHVQTIIANMERWRWVPRTFGPRYVSVNAADATLEAIDNGNVILTSPVIVGKPDSRTPLFSTTAVSLTINPSWHVPTPIVRHEILPKLRANPGYLARKHMVWREGGGIRQLPGAGNALGVLKFEMPNEFDTYLHDTPQHSFFAKADRHLSHGCIRVGKILQLGSFALTDDPDAGLDRIHSLIITHATRTISLDESLPVFVLYRTAIADADGAVNFMPDVYGRDQRLISALAVQQLSGRVTMNVGVTSRN
jgi:murein L,D-transpeptidase YcbB/YkuD